MEAKHYSKKLKTYSARVLFMSFFAGLLVSSGLLSAAPIRDSIVAASKINVSCNGGANGSATVGVKYGTAPYFYTWTPNVSSAATANGLSAGTYSIIVHDVLGNSGTTAVVTITQPSAIRDSIATNTGVGCNGGNGGSAKVGVKGGVAPYSYLWSTGGTLATASSLSAGNYSVRVTDKNGCNNTVNVTITQPNVISDNLGSLTNPSCNGAFGSVTINISGGTLPYTFTWTHGVSTTATATNLLAGNYTVTVKDAHACNGTPVSFTITQPVAIRDSIVMASKVNITCNGGNNGSATVAAKYGSLPYTYTWNPNVSATAAANNLSAGTYSVTVTDNNGCSSSTATVTITQPGALRDSVAAQANVGCNGGNGGSASIGVKYGKAPYTFAWSPNSDNTYSASSLTAGTYSVIVTDNNGCSNSLTVTITEPLAIRDSVAIISNPVCNGSTGNVTIGVKYGTAPYTYTWTGGISTTASASNLIAGTYTVTVKDNHSCSSAVIFTVTQPGGIRDSITNLISPLCGNGYGNITMGTKNGTPPYTYFWSNGSSTAVYTSNPAISLPAGTYTATITDNHGCNVTASATITTPVPLLAGARPITNISCNGGSTGSVFAYASGGILPYTYSWSDLNASTTATVDNLSAGSYTVYVTDNHGCTSIDSLTLTQPTRIKVNSQVVNHVLCNSSANGSAVVNVIGGTLPYTFTWVNSNSTVVSQSQVTPQVLSAGTYTVTVQDSCGNSVSSTATITEPSALRDSVATLGIIQCNGSTGGATIIGVAGGTSPYNYVWPDNISTTNSASGLSEGVYNVTVADANGCSSVVSFTLNQPLAIRDTIVKGSIINVACNGGSNGSATIGALNGVLPYTYAWSNGETNATATGLSAGVYAVSVTDSHGCTSSITAVSIAQPGILLESVSSVSCYNNKVSAALNIQGGTFPYTYLWSPGNETQQQLTGLAPGTYTITTTDACGNIATITSDLQCPPEEMHRKDDKNNPTLQNNGTISLYPNPNSGQFTLSGLEQGQTIEMYDYTGRKISAISSDNISMQLNIADQPVGIYLIRILDKDGNLVSQKKMVKTN
jgi:hypothetical protein